jgi:hypothetical protein
MVATQRFVTDCREEKMRNVLIASALVAATSPALAGDIVSKTPCTELLHAYGTEAFQAFELGGANDTDYVLTECRLHESYTIGQVQRLLAQEERENKLPAIPIGGATGDPKVHAQWQAYDKWLHHEGPRPDLSGQE